MSVSHSVGFGRWSRFVFSTMLLGTCIFPASGSADGRGRDDEKLGAQEHTSANDTASDAVVKAEDTHSGTLLFEATEPGLYVEAPMVATDVRIEVTGSIARAKVTQRFENPSDGWVEGIYLFPLLESAAVDTLRMQIGDRFIEGMIKEREEARRVYEAAKASGIKAGLVEQERPNVFKTSVANVGPRETIVVQIEYQESVRFDAGRFALRFPMVVAPRYQPAPTAGPTASLKRTAKRAVKRLSSASAPPAFAAPVMNPAAWFRTNPVRLRVHIHAGVALGNVTSSFHHVDVERPNDHEAIAVLTHEVAANRDFELSWNLVSATPQAALFKEHLGDSDYLYAMIVPPPRHASNQHTPREAIFVIDNSGSMSGESMRQAKESLLLGLSRLSARDTFNVIRFDDSLTVLFDEPVPADKEHVGKALEYVRGLDAQGGTEMLPALAAALRDEKHDAARVRQVVFLTDGSVGNEHDMFEEITAHLGRSRLFTVGIGSAPNTYFMSRAARLGRGTFTHIGSTNEVKDRTLELLTKLERPVMTQLEASLPGAELWPNPLPDLYDGEPVMLTARFSEKSGRLGIKGRLPNGKTWQASFDTSHAQLGRGIGKLWGRSKIEILEERRFLGTPIEDIDRGVLDVALAFHLVSRRTSLVAVDITPSRPTDTTLHTRAVPLHLPAGWDFEKVFGPVPSQSATRWRVPKKLAVARAAGQETTEASTMADAVDLPATATPMGLLFVSGLALYAIALLAWLAVRKAPRRGCR